MIALACAAVFAVLLVVGFFLYFNYQRVQLDNEVSQEFIEVLSDANTLPTEEFDQHLFDRGKAHPHLIYWSAQRTPGVRDLARSGNADRILLPLKLSPGWVEVGGIRGIEEHHAMEFRARGKAALIVPPEGSARATLIFVGRDLRSELAIALKIAYWALGAFGAIALFLPISAILTARFVVKRIRDISVTAEHIIQGDFSSRIKTGTANDEFDQLAGTLNLMLDRIQKLVSGVKEVSDNIAHDLRTPLYRLRSRIELALLPTAKSADSSGAREALELTLKETDRLLLTFNALLSIARIESGAMRDQIAEVDIADVIKDVAELYEPAAEDRALRIETHAEPGLKLRANRALIVQALSNLVDNALKYAPKGTRILIVAQGAEPARLWRDSVDIIVADQGPGIAPDDRGRALQRFVRLDASETTPGSGLGLSLVSAIASLHDAKLTLEDGADGIGLTVRLRFTAPA
ncbi:MAG: ATP-binding protein [Alphaproteobacteria bacterium]